VRWLRVVLRILVVPALVFVPLGLFLKALGLKGSQTKSAYAHWKKPVSYGRAKRDRFLGQIESYRKQLILARNCNREALLKKCINYIDRFRVYILSLEVFDQSNFLEKAVGKLFDPDNQFDRDGPPKTTHRRFKVPISVVCDSIFYTLNKNFKLLNTRVQVTDPSMIDLHRNLKGLVELATRCIASDHSITELAVTTKQLKALDFIGFKLPALSDTFFKKVGRGFTHLAQLVLDWTPVDHDFVIEVLRNLTRLRVLYLNRFTINDRLAIFKLLIHLKFLLRFSIQFKDREGVDHWEKNILLKYPGLPTGDWTYYKTTSHILTPLNLPRLEAKDSCFISPF